MNTALTVAALSAFVPVLSVLPSTRSLRKLSGQRSCYHRFRRSSPDGRHRPARLRGGMAPRCRVEGCADPESDGAGLCRAAGAFRRNGDYFSRSTVRVPAWEKWGLSTAATCDPLGF
jgi:hypothetical protein